jgi:hypothetical protein
MRERQKTRAHRQCQRLRRRGLLAYESVMSIELDAARAPATAGSASNSSTAGTPLFLLL